MEISPLFHFSRSYARTRPEIDSGASLFADGLPRSASIAPATDWIFLLVRQCAGDKLWIRSELSPLGGIVPS